MESMLEKITLYDILGYLFPGIILLLMILLGGMPKETQEFMAWWDISNSRTVLYLIFVLAGYLTGVVLSELNELIQLMCKKPVSWIKGTPVGQRLLANDRQTAEMTVFFQTQLAQALRNSGISEDAGIIEQRLQTGEGAYYYKYVYGAIQGSPDHKRLHSYASACVMYKNMAAAILCGSFILFFKFHVNGYFCVAGILVSIILGIRSGRFKGKKNQYALIWFLEKYGRV